MAIKLTVSEGAGQWLLQLLEKMENDWHWNSHDQRPSDDDRIFHRELKQGLEHEVRRQAANRWELPGQQ